MVWYLDMGRYEASWWASFNVKGGSASGSVTVSVVVAILLSATDRESIVE